MEKPKRTFWPTQYKVFKLIYWFPRCLSGNKKKKKKILLPVQEMQETKFQALGQEGPLEEKMATHCSVLAWKIS